MRKVAAYSMQQTCRTASDAASRQSEICAAINSWIASKGTLSIDAKEIRLFDGRLGSIATEKLASNGSSVEIVALEEPINAGIFRTELTVSRMGSLIQVYVELRVASHANNLGPISVEIRCPSVVRQILAQYGEWKLGETLLVTTPVEFNGESGGQNLIRILWHPDRNLPIVCVSEDEDGPIDGEFAAGLAADLTGLAIVAQVDSAASWSMTNARGQEWSCFNGAVRLFWPRLRTESDPFIHPLWTKSALLRQSDSSKEASQRLRRQLRRRILGISAFAVNEPEESKELRKQLYTESVTAERQRLEDNSDWQALAESYAAENVTLRQQTAVLEADNKDLQVQLENLQEALQWRESKGLEVQPEVLQPPTTVEEAVNQARHQFRNLLYFGEDVALGVQGLSPEAGPPDKVLDYLRGLNTLAEELADGPLGISIVQWLKQRNFETSTESDTIKNSKREMAKRTWKGPNGPMEFDLHMKPKEGVSPDKCVRIYFEVEQNDGRIVVGWVGRHPG
jgi:hypothetical protein